MVTTKAKVSRFAERHVWNMSEADIAFLYISNLTEFDYNIGYSLILTL